MDVVCLGLMVCDVLVKPVTKKIFEMDLIRVESVKTASGGDSLNVAMNLRKLGVSSAVMGKVGKDLYGQFLLDTAKKNLVDIGCVTITEDVGTSTSIVLIQPDGERFFAYYGGASNHLSDEDLNYSMIEKAKILSVGSAFGLPGLDGDKMAYVLKWAQEKGVKTILDVTGNPDMHDMETLKYTLKYTDVFIPSYEEARNLSGAEKTNEMAEVFLSHGVGLAVIKHGSEGCHIYSRNEFLQHPCNKGLRSRLHRCGDSFVSGFTYALLKKLPIYECGRFANKLGALCVTELGATLSNEAAKEAAMTINSLHKS